MHSPKKKDTLRALRRIHLLGIPSRSPRSRLGNTSRNFRTSMVRCLCNTILMYSINWCLGPMVKLSLAGDDIIVLSRPADAEELVRTTTILLLCICTECRTQLGRRSHNYSSRRPLIYAGKYQSNNKRMVLLPYGEHLKKQRAAFHQMLQPRGLCGHLRHRCPGKRYNSFYQLLARMKLSRSWNP